MTLRAVLQRCDAAIDRAGRAVWRAVPEILTAGAFLGGWLLVTAGVVRLTSPVAWVFSGGLLLLSLGGWKLLWVLVRDGLYVLTQTTKGRRTPLG